MRRSRSPRDTSLSLLVFRSIRSDCSANPFDSFQWKVRARVHPRYRSEIGERNFPRRARTNETYAIHERPAVANWPKIWRIFNVREQRLTGR